MNNRGSFFLILQFIISVAAYSINAPIEIWFGLSVIYLFNLVNAIVQTISTRFPLIEYILFFVYLQNTLCLTMLYFAFLTGSSVEMEQICSTNIDEFFPFVFLSVQVAYIGYILFVKKTTDWMIFFRNIETLVPIEKLHQLIVIGVVGTIISFANISELDFVITVLKSFSNCALVILLILPDYKYKKILYVVVAYQLAQSLSTGLIGESISFTFTIAIYIIIFKKIKGDKVSWPIVFGLAVIGLLFVCFLQNIKGEYRTKTWQGAEDIGVSTFYDVAQENKENFTPAEFGFYLGVLIRLNHSGISSATLNVVPYNIPFEEGATIVRSLVDAFVPRIFNPNKEKAGGREKYEKYTGRKLIGSTSMNIGLIGEGYINFGKNGCIILFFVFGVLIALFENKVLMVSKTYPIILVFIPFYISTFIQTENDFMIVLNTFVKGSFIIVVFIYYAGFKRERKNI